MFVAVVVVVENVAYQDDQCCRLCIEAACMLCQPAVLFRPGLVSLQKEMYDLRRTRRTKMISAVAFCCCCCCCCCCFESVAYQDDTVASLVYESCMYVVSFVRACSDFSF